MQTITYATAMADYTLKFVIVSFDAKLAEELAHTVESISFFDPAQAKALAGDNARPLPLGISGNTPKPTHMAQLSAGAITANTYTNDTLGLTFQYPAGWVLADKATQKEVSETEHRFAYGSDPAAAREHETVQECSKILLWATQFPEASKTDVVNPLVLVTAFDSDCLQGLELPKSPADTDAIQKIGKQFVQALSGAPFFGNRQNRISAFTFQNRIMLDLSTNFRVTPPNGKQPVDVFTSILITREGNYWIIWALMNGSRSGVDDLEKQIRIGFRSAPATQPGE
jgi:hypothetical protein